MNYIITKQMKSKGVAALLVFLFWPIGMFYSTFSGAVIMSFIVGPVVVYITLSTPFGIILLPIFFIICLVWAVQAVNNYNHKILHEATSYNNKEINDASFNTNSRYDVSKRNSNLDFPINNNSEQEINDLYQDLGRISALYFSKVINEEQYIKQKENTMKRIEFLKHNNLSKKVNPMKK